MEKRRMESGFEGSKGRNSGNENEERNGKKMAGRKGRASYTPAAGFLAGVMLLCRRGVIICKTVGNRDGYGGCNGCVG